MKGESGRYFNEVERVAEGKERGGWVMLISAVNALTCNMDLIA